MRRVQLKTFLGGAVSFVVFALLFLSLLTHRAMDPSWNTFTTRGAENLLGKFGSTLSDALLQTLGGATYFLLPPLFLWGVTQLWGKRVPFPMVRGMLVLFAVSIGALALTMLGLWGGVVGYLLFGWMARSVPFFVTFPLLVLGLFAYMFALGAWGEWRKRWNSLVYFLGRAAHFFLRWRRTKEGMPKKVSWKEPPAPKSRTIVRKQKEKKAPPPSESLPVPSTGYVPPSLGLLQSTEETQRIPEWELQQRAAELEKVLSDFGIRGQVVRASPGPVVTMYALAIPASVKAARIISLADDIARRMRAVSCRIAMIPGERELGVEIPNRQRQVVGLRALLESRVWREARGRLPVVLGRDIFGQPVVADMSTMPHLLIAGTTGSGKSVGINAMILSLLYRFGPRECRLIMIDPKMLELSVYEGIPHLLMSVVTDPKKASQALQWVVTEMEERYRRMSKLGVRSIEGYNALVRRAKKPFVAKKMQVDDGQSSTKFETEEIPLEHAPYILVVIDEMADLMLVTGREIESAVQRLAQMARASGIHMITATQRPSVDVITGTIKANFPSRISYSLSSRVDSRVVIGDGGAEQLLGKGDMLFVPHGGRIRRLHAPLVTDEEVHAVCGAIKSQNAREPYLQLPDPEMGDQESSDTAGDDIYAQALEIVRRDRRVSTSYIQRRLRIGYNRAANLVDQMERDGYISAPDHVGKRQIFMEEQS